MNIPCIQDILPLVEQPSRYLGSEINTVKKDLAQVRLRFALAFPDLYEIGTSHFGLQILYDILNRQEEIAAERVFAPATDMEARLRQAGLPVPTLESGVPLGSFDIVGFSLLYELNFTNVLTLLDLAGIPFLSSERDASHPMIIAGGPCTCNPEPVADFFDAIVIGDGEEVILEMARTWMAWQASGSSDREALLREWSRIRGVYIPAFFEAASDENGAQTLTPRFPDYTTVSRALVADLDRSPFPTRPVIPFGRPVHDRLRLELARGCTRGCRFCQAGMIYRPVRERAPETLLGLSDAAIAATGYEDISLLSLSTGDYGCIGHLMAALMARYEAEHVAISLPSLRAGTLTPELMELIKKVRKTGFTIAPEAGSQRMRDVINKNVTEQDIVDTVTDAFTAGWQVIKLYFMIGLPTETREDVEAIVELVKRLKQIRGPKGRKGKINVSVGTFIPKSHTPFQWCDQISLAESREKISWLRDQFRMPGVQFKWQNPEVSLLEGIWARGDRRLSGLLTAAYRRGCRFDGWSDHFRFDLWQAVMDENGVTPDAYTARRRDTDAPLPWDHIDTGVTREFLVREWENALAGGSTGDCRDGECNNCGVCDFDAIAPKVFSRNGSDPTDGAVTVSESQPPAGFKTLQVFYAKQGQARFFGHLEMVSIFLRAIRRAGIAVKYSQGFHPMPRVAFNDPLPIGMESRKEAFFITVADTVRPDTVVSGLNAGLPDGLSVSGCFLAPSKSARRPSGPVGYEVTLKNDVFDAVCLQAFEDRAEHMITRTSRKGKVRTLDLKEIVLTARLHSPVCLRLELINAPGKTLRPAGVLREIFGFSEETIRQATLIKL
ncbi:B12-binding domain-containing radical SAM protei n [Desulfonema ishimotonii]|uniref:B12-binding domain-containing radical SAM protei n n=1 Tax=Desulfonema ishimotonii TaxID=45657 RepID=A0A401G3L6_9BACT|nr:TIGR03960 family B12-binding radical SAM protein [Desulfonema ishimotonii]GBC63806.1 B12-binding domain-containing radical SAM protei n [Desulfonema ishimotonii]